jgi:hypothetical protein
MERINNYSATLHLDTMKIEDGALYEILMNCYLKHVRKSTNDHVDDELNEIIYDDDTITFRDGHSYNNDKNGAIQSKYYKTYKSVGGFSVNHLFKCIADFEKDIRSMEKNKVHGNLDQHHIFFEGITLQEDKAYTICWGS